MYLIPKRSVTGCLTCKRRKKKCDEARPVCQRCMKGDFVCLGYALDSTDSLGGLDRGAFGKEIETDAGSILVQHMPHHSTGGTHGILMTSTESPLLPEPVWSSIRVHQRDLALHPVATVLSVPKPLCIPVDEGHTDEMISLILKHYKKIIQHIIFKPPAITIEDGLRSRIKSSTINRWSLYLGARILNDLSNGRDGQRYLSWVTQFYQHIMKDTASGGLDLAGLGSRMSGLRNLTTWVFMLSGISQGYFMLKSYSCVFLRTAALFPELWETNAAISISKVFRIRQLEIKNFVLQDTIIALALGTPPIVHYDVSSPWVVEAPHLHIEWIYGFPVGIILMLAKVNSWRVARFMGQAATTDEWRSIEEQLQKWTPDVSHGSDASDSIARLVVQECWRQATLVYLYMGMCEVHSNDPRVQLAVQQIVQLACTIKDDSPLRAQLLIPCLIAGAAARREKHRAVARNKILKTRDLVLLIFRGMDFIPVLDHLWHGPASEGRPITWQDYVHSRCAVLPIVS